MRVVSPRRALHQLSLLLGAALFVSCGGDGGSPSPTPTDVIVTPGADTLFALGATQTFSATVLDANGDPIDGATVTWSSTAPSVVSVDPSSGVATALTNGSAQVKATSGALEGTAPITVAQVPTTVTIAPATGNFTYVGDTLTFTATVLDAGGAPVVPVQKIWTLNDNTVAVIDSNGLARAKGAGLAMVTVVAIGPGGAKAGYAAVNSTQPAATLTFRAQPSEVEAGESVDPAVQAEVRDSGNAVVGGYSGAVTISVDSGPAGAVLHGTKTVNAVNGVVSYSGLWLDKAGSYRFQVTAATLAPAISAGFAVGPTVPHHLTVTYDPTLEANPMPAGGTLRVNAELRDRFDNLSTDTTLFVQVDVVGGPAGGAIVGNMVGQRFGNGIIYFPGATLQKAGPGYLLRVTGDGVLPDTTPAFTVAAGAPGRLRLLTDSAMAVGLTLPGPGPTFRIEDLFGNPVPPGPSFGVALSTAAWPFAAPAGKGQGIDPPNLVFVDDTGSFPFRTLLRPGPTALVVSASGLIPDTGTVRDYRFGGIVDVTAGGDQTCIQSLHWCVGDNGRRQLGISTALLSSDSVFVYPDSAFDDSGPYAMGVGHTCGVDIILGIFVPAIMCRGANDEGQLGRGTTGPDQEQFVRIPGSNGWWAVAVGAAHSCALAADSTAVCWGRNDHGQLGRGTTSANEPTPAAVNGGIKFKAIAAGGDHTCGITTTSGMRCWGANASGELGDSTLVDRSAPTTVIGTYTWVEVAAGTAFTCGIKSNTGLKLLCWGNNAVGQLGDPGAGATRSYPGLVTGGLNDLPGGLTAGSAHACAIANVTIICWGDDSRGQLGNGPTNVPLFAPYGIPFPDGRSAHTVTAGAHHTCAVGTDLSDRPQRVYCWGANDLGQLGDATTTDRSYPTAAFQ